MNNLFVSHTFFFLLSKNSLRFSFSWLFPFISLFLFLLLSGCSSTSSKQNSFVQNNFSAAKLDNDSLRFYWYSEKTSRSFSAEDDVRLEDGTWYKSDYRWKEDVLREIVRVGELSQQDPFCYSSCNDESTDRITYRLHVRFNQEGEAIYQRYRVNNRVLPLTPEQLAQYQQQAKELVETTQKLNKKRRALFQGLWNGEYFETCQTSKKFELAFDSTLPASTIEHFSMKKQETNASPITKKQYIAFIGEKYASSSVKMQQILKIDEGFSDDAKSRCVEKPVLLRD